VALGAMGAGSAAVEVAARMVEARVATRQCAGQAAKSQIINPKRFYNGTWLSGRS